MKKRILVLLAAIFTLVGCKPEGRVYVEHQELSPKVEWLKKDSRTFEVPVEDISLAYNLGMSFRYATGYQFDIARIKVTETSPSGKESVKEYDLKVRDDKGDYVGDPGLDIWDSEHVVESNKKYEEKGKYTYKVEHNMPEDPMNFAMEIGVILDKAK